jgi:hypothetical protein
MTGRRTAVAAGIVALVAFVLAVGLLARVDRPPDRFRSMDELLAWLEISGYPCDFRYPMGGHFPPGAEVGVCELDPSQTTSGLTLYVHRDPTNVPSPSDLTPGSGVAWLIGENWWIATAYVSEVRKVQQAIGGTLYGPVPERG